MFGPFKNEYELTKVSRGISYLLRHRPYEAEIQLDEHGWADVEQLLENLPKIGQPHITREQLDFIVDNDSKQRYSYSDDGKFIRANQGHSFPVDVEMPEMTPPDILWHGTAAAFSDSIESSGLKKMSRLHVHLSADLDTAIAVGTRHGSPIVYEVATGQMNRDGYVFYLSENGVWLTDNVPPEYLTRVR